MKINCQLIKDVWYLSATLPDGRLRYSTGIRPGETAKETKEAEYRLTFLRQQAAILMRTLENENRLTVANLRGELDIVRGRKRKSGTDLWTFADKWIRSYSLSHPESTVKSFKALLGHIKIVGTVELSDANDAYFDRLLAHFYGLGYSRNFTGKMISNYRRILREARERNLWHGRPEKYRGSSEEVYSIYLTREEVERIRVHPFDGSLANVRDQFLIGCYTGLRYSDFSRVSAQGDTIEIIQQKTGTRVIIPIHPHIREIVKKDLRVISNQKMNEYLKDMGRLCGIDTPVSRTRTLGNKKVTTQHKKWELITTHTARRTAITLMFLAGIP